MSEEGQQPQQSAEKNPKSSVLQMEDWKEKFWEAGRIGFHSENVNTLLQKYGDKLLAGRSGLKVLVPLCGKTVDMMWFADKGHTVIGVEGVEQAVLEFFAEQKLEFTKEPLQEIDGDLYKSTDEKIRIYKCDFFNFNRSLEGRVDVIWDRASLEAINVEDREKYASIIKSLASPDCRIFLSTVDYDETKYAGPPHYLSHETIVKLYGDPFNVEILDRQDAMHDCWRNHGLTYFDDVLHFLSPK